MKRIVGFALLGVLVFAAPVEAASGTIRLDQAAPYHIGDSLTFTTSVGGDTKANSSTYIWAYCQIGSDLPWNVRQPRDSVFSPTGWTGATADCHAILVYEWVYGGGKVGRQYLANIQFAVGP